MTSSACITSEYHLSLLSMSTEGVLYFLTDFSHFMTKTLMIMSLNNFAQLKSHNEGTVGMYGSL